MRKSVIIPLKKSHLDYFKLIEIISLFKNDLKLYVYFNRLNMDGSNGNDGDGNPSPVPHNPERIAILDAGAQYGKVNK